MPSLQRGSYTLPIWPGRQLKRGEGGPTTMLWRAVSVVAAAVDTLESVDWVDLFSNWNIVKFQH